MIDCINQTQSFKNTAIGNRVCDRTPIPLYSNGMIEFNMDFMICVPSKVYSYVKQSIFL